MTGLFPTNFRMLLHVSRYAIVLIRPRLRILFSTMKISSRHYKHTSVVCRTKRSNPRPGDYAVIVRIKVQGIACRLLKASVFPLYDDMELRNQDLGGDYNVC
jgi:hypothetical protein